MTCVLTVRERKLLEYLQLDHKTFQIKGQLPVGFGAKTRERLTIIRLLETGAGKFGETGWRLTADGWRCMHGKTLEEMMESQGPHHPLKVWSVPPLDR